MASKYYSDRQLDAAGRVLKQMAAERAAKQKADEKKLNDARESALRYAHYRETGRK